MSDDYIRDNIYLSLTQVGGSFSEFLLGLIVVDLLLGDLEEAHHVLGRVLHKDVLTGLLLVLVDDIDHQLQDGPALSHIQVDLVAVAAGIGAVGTKDHVVVRVLQILSGHEGKLDVLDTGKNGLDDPARDLA